MDEEFQNQDETWQFYLENKSHVGLYIQEENSPSLNQYALVREQYEYLP